MRWVLEGVGRTPRPSPFPHDETGFSNLSTKSEKTFAESPFLDLDLVSGNPIEKTGDFPSLSPRKAESPDKNGNRLYSFLSPPLLDRNS
jgi:hypothetical protein